MKPYLHKYNNSFVTYMSRKQTGITLVELMISLALSLFVVMAATALFLSTKSAYLAQDDSTQILDTGRYAVEILARAVRQAAYENWDVAEAPAVSTEFLTPNVFGLDSRSLKSRSVGIEAPVSKAINGSDVLAIRFFGAGTEENGDGTMLNCAGFSVGAVPTAEAAEESRGWSIFYVAEDSTGEPELYCKYRGNTSWASQSIARGVESFQVLYGLDTDADGFPNRLLNATAINALDNSLVLNGVNAAERIADKNKKTHWKKVVVVKLALLVRGSHVTRPVEGATEYHLFGKGYASGNGVLDVGTRITEADLPKAVRGRERRIFTTTIWLRNHFAENRT
ncbi:MAG TPA: PilW family protein [Noviherbaspirillum sp.]|nr:PilW family protein [Noviherbaspirillum sp.]